MPALWCMRLRNSHLFSDAQLRNGHVVASYKIRNLCYLVLTTASLSGPRPLFSVFICGDETSGIIMDLALSNIQYSPLKKQSENPTAATTRKRNWMSILKLRANLHPF